MAMGKDSQIVRVERQWVMERECKRMGKDCLGQGKTEEGNPGRYSG